ncbi:GntR family transcriptional regulator [Aureimonas phyllosphaerae]|uniref:GntR family transcriptional regulator n=1 Tax=Aureimonas phyllosphaerae TaxID=1166078 RepID=UPI003A5BDB67
MSETVDPSIPERRRGSGARLVYEQLRDEILDLHLSPGSPIDEVALAERFGLSRTPIREALVRLQGEGLVTALPNRSTLVASLDAAALPPFFDALVLMYRVTTRLAAEHHRADDLDAIRARQVAFAGAVAAQDALAMIATNAAFHSAIADSGRNPYFASLFDRLLNDGRRLLRLYYDSYQDRLPPRFVEEHEDLIAAIAARDVDEADRLAGIHAEQIVEQIDRLMKRRSDLAIPLARASVDK